MLARRLDRCEPSWQLERLFSNGRAIRKPSLDRGAKDRGDCLAAARTVVSLPSASDRAVFCSCASGCVSPHGRPRCDRASHAGRGGRRRGRFEFPRPLVRGPGRRLDQHTPRDLDRPQWRRTRDRARKSRGRAHGPLSGRCTAFAGGIRSRSGQRAQRHRNERRG